MAAAAAAAVAAAEVPPIPIVRSHRDLSIEMFSEMLDISHDDCVELEIGIYNTAIKRSKEVKIICAWRNRDFTRMYDNICVTILSNIRSPSSRLAQRLKDGEFAPSKLADMTPQEMMPELWKPLIDKTIWRNEHVLEERPAAMTDSFKCGKCKKRECTYQELQLRSADEPMTIFVTCLNCGHRWRI